MTTKICKNCDYCQRLYQSVFYSFGKCNVFICSDKSEPTNLSDSCENWQRKTKRLDLSSQRFDEAEDDINFLMKNLEAHLDSFYN